MKDTDIPKIHQLLQSILLIYGGNNYQLGEWAKEALALLPCCTCNGLKVISHGNWTNKPCPDCCQSSVKDCDGFEGEKLCDNCHRHQEKPIDK